MTLEEAQARIIELEEQLEERTTERDTLSQNNTQLSADLERVRTLNQRYFEKLSAQHPTGGDDHKDDETEDAPTCEEFAKKLSII